MSEFFTCLTFDLDAESAQVRQGDEPSRISKGQFAINKGVPRILSLLKEHHIQSTFFVCGWIGEIYPDTINNILSEGHEIAAHGYQHE
ncbi:MAG: polysaccharide deacetylase family protein, partial [Candidatus Heimdallarchaeaceae archaeon]